VSDPYLREYLSAGKALERDRSQGLRAIESLAYRGSALSMLFLADALRKGDAYEVDLEKSEGWYSHAASFGSGRALYGLGLIRLAKRNTRHAIEAFEAAGARGCGAGMWAIGLLYKQGGQDVPPDIDRARTYLKRGASLGHVWSSRTLSLLLMTGRYGFWARLRGCVIYLAYLVAAPVAIIGGRIDRVMR
jgi:TPR repeat protein